MPAQPDSIGRYRLQSILGHGGMGVVYLALDPALDRKVAIKVLHLSGDEQMQERAIREARAAARLAHPNIVTVYDVGEVDGSPFIAMEYVDGQTLAEFIRRRSPLSLPRKLSIVEDIAAGLQHAHDAGLVHRDVKPANVMIARNGLVKILDFGTAKMAADGSITRAGTIIGSPLYMSPEQILGGEIDRRADIFALGSTLFELLTGRKVFQGELSAVMEQIVHGSVPLVSTLVADAPAALDRVVQRALEKSADARYQDLKTMRRDLARIRYEIELMPEEGSDALRAAEDLETAERVQEPTAERPEDTGASTVMVTAAVPPATVEDAPVDPGTVIFAQPRNAGQANEAPQARARLVVAVSGDPRLTNKSFDLGQQTFVIGRSPDANLSANDITWSRRSAEIECRDGGFFVTSVSRNPIFLDGRLLTAQKSYPLMFGAQIAIGSTRLSFAPARDIALPDLAGTEIAGRYLLESLLRESAQGPLYAARLNNLPRRVAVKLLSPELMRYPGYKERFKRRAVVTSQLHHPHICRVNDYGETRITAAGSAFETAYLCIDLMTGGSLEDRLAAAEPVPLPQVERWISLLADALNHAHDAHAIHGDLKPAAVVFDAAGNPYLTDFGVDREQSTEVVVGTPAYMSPEQWESSEIGPRTDQFGLALLAYTLIAGTRPFEGQDNAEVRRRNFARGPLPAHEEARQHGREDVNPHVSVVLERALSVSPDARYASIQDFATDLRRALEGAGAPRDPSQPPQVFLSYQRGASTGWAVHIAEQLHEKHGVHVFLDLERVDLAVRFPDRLAEAIQRADVFVCLVGSTTLESGWVRREIELAVRYRKPMIPILEDGFVVPDDPSLDPSIRTLFTYDGVPLLDQYREYAILDLAKRITNTVSTLMNPRAADGKRAPPPDRI
jgi:serine/threonine protein kinase